MKKTLKIIFFVSILAVLTYGILWFAILFSLSNSINQKYSDTYLNIDDSQQYFVKFSKAKPYGFPFKFGISIINWQEESVNRKIEFNSPINIGYDLLKQQIFVDFSGEAVGRFKPIERGFGVKFYNDNCILSAKMPLSLGLFKIVKEKKDFFEIINFIEDVKFTLNKAEIFDLVDNKKLYEEDHTLFNLEFDKSKYYTSKQDFLDNIPQKLEINYDTEIIHSDLEDRIIPAGLLLYRLAWHNNFKFSANFLITAGNPNFKDFAKDLTIEITNAQINSNSFENNINLLYKGKLDGLGNNNVNLLIDSKFKLKQDSITSFLSFIRKYYDRQNYLLTLSDNESYKSLNSKLSYVLDSNQEFDFSILENREYDFKLNASLFTELNKLTRAQINALSLYSNRTGFNITNETLVSVFKDSYSKGDIIANNYPKIMEVLSSYINKNLSEESKEIYKNAFISFFKTISDHPNSSNLTDVSFEYNFDLSDLNKTKIGTIDDINKILPLYYLSLYQAAVKEVKTGDNLKEKIMELIPDFKEHQKILEKCMLPGFQDINETMWQEITK
ncbi:hypothetical protein [Rickettsia endosymbiont of Nabis limbatus]|uniref:hypothetical protein n=1 Tax=Rickettsia endosymbiont of Nabis limbatus TaxID=3066268 RepID=UPI003AF3721A